MRSLCASLAVLATLAGIVALPASAASAASARPSVTAVSPPAGRTTGGNTIAIEGIGLSSATAVYFASVPSTKITHVSSTRITAQVPPHSARTVHVRVAGPGGRSAEVSGDRYSYVAHAPEFNWTKRQLVDKGNLIADMSCASAGFCVAVDDNGNALTFDGRTWSAPERVDPDRSFAQVECPVAGYCVALDTPPGQRAGTSYALVLDNGVWRRSSALADDYLDLSCSSRALCTVVTDDGHAEDYVDGTWQTPTKIDSQAVHAVDCPDDGFCLAMDAIGREIVFDGTSWGSPASTGASDQRLVTSVSCSSRYYCVSGSDFARGRRNGVWQQLTFANEAPTFYCGPDNFCVGSNESDDFDHVYLSTGDAASLTHPNLVNPAMECPTAAYCIGYFGDSVSTGRRSN